MKCTYMPHHSMNWGNKKMKTYFSLVQWLSTPKLFLQLVFKLEQTKGKKFNVVCRWKNKAGLGFPKAKMVKTALKKVFWGGFKASFSGGVWTLRVSVRSFNIPLSRRGAVIPTIPTIRPRKSWMSRWKWLLWKVCERFFVERVGRPSAL